MLRRDSLFLSILAMLLVTPASFALGLYWLTNDPTLRPLAQTHANVSGNDAPRRHSIVTIIAMPSGGAHPTLEQAIANAFDTYDTSTLFRYEHAPGTGIQISYHAGKSRIGPFSLRRASEGIRPAVEAQRLARHHSNVAAPAQTREGGWLSGAYSD